jgi:hypothetical protein
MASHLDVQKIWIIGFFFENMLHWQFEGETKFQQTAIVDYIFMYIQIKLYFYRYFLIDKRAPQTFSTFLLMYR